jgi:glycosyltransferase involved in cell wall biosynthesis
MTSRPLKVCFLIDRLALGGTETQLLKLIDSFDRKRILPHLVLLDGLTSTSQTLEPSGVEVMRLGIRSLLRPATITGLLRCAKQLKKWQIDAVQVIFPDSTYFGVAAARLAGTKVILRTRRDLFYWTNSTQRCFGRILDGLYNKFLVNAMITNSEACRLAALATELLPPRRIAVIRNGLNPKPFDTLPYRAPMTVKTGEFRVAVVSMLRPEKRVDVFVEAAARVINEVPRVRFAIAGEGPMRQSIEESINAKHISNMVQLKGSVGDVPRFLLDVDVAVLCSETEGASNALIEYMMAGRAIVATAVGGNKEMIDDGRTGLLVPANDAPALANAIVNYLRNPVLAQSCGDRARREARRLYAIDTTTRAYEKFLLQVTQHRMHGHQT